MDYLLGGLSRIGNALEIFKEGWVLIGIGIIFLFAIFFGVAIKVDKSRQKRLEENEQSEAE